MNTPTKAFNDIVIKDEILEEYKNTVINFLSNPKMQDICKKRRVILYGPPGTGKTSLVTATKSPTTAKTVDVPEDLFLIVSFILLRMVKKLTESERCIVKLDKVCIKLLL
jgi:ATP-dependent 26S proteasome regulatory subunit